MDVVLTLSLLATLLPIALLYAFQIPLGESAKLVYRYTSVLPVRLLAIILLLPAVLLVAAAVWLLASTRPAARWGGYTCGALAITAALVWNFWAPPQQIMQHWFNFRSPSHDGAFVNEAQQVMGDAPSYLRQFNERINSTQDHLLGTRVISNPPLTTVFFKWVLQAWPASTNPPGMVERWYLAAPNSDPITAWQFAQVLKLAIFCTAMLALAGVVAMGLGRMFLSPIGAFVFAVITVVNPYTLHFNPGKDPAQLFTVNLMLLAWFIGYRRRWWWAHAIAGAVLGIGMGVGLIHLWVAIAVLVATAWHACAIHRPPGQRRLARKLVRHESTLHPSAQQESARHDSPQPLSAVRESAWGPSAQFLFRHVLPTVAGGVALWLIVWLAVGWNMAGTFLAVSRRWTELQPSLGFNQPLWTVIGFPIVLVFMAPAMWLLMVSTLRPRWIGWPRTLGARLVISTLAVMALTYSIGAANELPRLWVVFLPPLLLGLLMQQPLACGRAKSRIVVFVAVVLILHLLGGAVHWAMLDARESEHRLVSRRLFN